MKTSAYFTIKQIDANFKCYKKNNPFLVYRRELAPGTVSLTRDRAQGDDSKHDSHLFLPVIVVILRINTIDKTIAFIAD